MVSLGQRDPRMCFCGGRWSDMQARAGWLRRRAGGQAGRQAGRRGEAGAAGRRAGWLAGCECWESGSAGPGGVVAAATGLAGAEGGRAGGRYVAEPAGWVREHPVAKGHWGGGGTFATLLVPLPGSSWRRNKENRQHAPACIVNCTWALCIRQQLCARPAGTAGKDRRKRPHPCPFPFAMLACLDHPNWSLLRFFQPVGNTPTRNRLAVLPFRGAVKSPKPPGPRPVLQPTLPAARLAWLSVWLAACLSVWLSVCPAVCLSVRPFVRLPVRLSVCPPARLLACLLAAYSSWTPACACPSALLACDATPRSVSMYLQTYICTPDCRFEPPRRLASLPANGVRLRTPLPAPK